jgi:hypothetical protein
VGRKVRQVRRPLGALLGLRGKTCKEDIASVLECAGRTYGVDVAPLAEPRDNPEAAHGALTKLLAAAITDVQALETGPTSLRGAPRA